MNTKARIGGLLLILGTVLFVGGAVGYITRHLPAEHISGSGALALIFVGVGAKFYILVLLYPIIYVALSYGLYLLMDGTLGDFASVPPWYLYPL